MRHIARLLQEPLLHFFAVGGLIFLLYLAASERDPEPVGTIVVKPERIEKLARGFERAWRRPPTDAELGALIDDFVREEIYYREALALGLDRNDTVIRRRLRQKMEFLSDTGADLLEPAPGELEAYFAENEEAFRQGPRLAFEQIYLGESPAPATIQAALGTLRTDPATEPSAFGESTVLPARLRPSPPAAVDGVFGKGFYQKLAELPPGMWFGPLQSAYGAHLVRVIESVPARLPPLEEIRDAVLRDWKAAKARELRELHYERLRERYVVEIRDTASDPARRE